jgi:pilus assembly protein CpaB
MGRRAITVPVDEINSISGMLEPGDMIDLYVSLDYQGRKITLPLLQAVEVMATGQRAIDDPKSGERREFTTVTLDTTPEQAQSVIVARDTGKITALLRNPQDKKPLPEARGDVAGLLGLKDRGDTASMGLVDPQVPVLYGGQGRYTDEQLNLAAGRHQGSQAVQVTAQANGNGADLVGAAQQMQAAQAAQAVQAEMAGAP